jgi:hypothetical protein
MGLKKTIFVVVLCVCYFVFINFEPTYVKTLYFMSNLWKHLFFLIHFFELIEYINAIQIQKQK